MTGNIGGRLVALSIAMILTGMGTVLAVIFVDRMVAVGNHYFKEKNIRYSRVRKK